MEALLAAMSAYGFPMVVAAYLLVRVETRLDRLSECIQELARAIGAKNGAWKACKKGVSAMRCRWLLFRYTRIYKTNREIREIREKGLWIKIIFEFKSFVLLFTKNVYVFIINSSLAFPLLLCLLP